MPRAWSSADCTGRAYIARGAIAEYLDGAHYLKITCMSGERLHGASNLAIRSAAQGTE